MLSHATRSIEKLYLMIAEPRHIRMMLFVVYVTFTLSGIDVIFDAPGIYLDVVGQPLMTGFGIILIAGGLLGAVSVLQGIWLLERPGLILLFTAMVNWTLLRFAVGSKDMIILIPFVLTIFLAIRYLDIKDAQLAPKEV